MPETETCWSVTLHSPLATEVLTGLVTSMRSVSSVETIASAASSMMLRSCRSESDTGAPRAPACVA